MRISCPSCETSYDLPAESIGENGRKVKCATCGTKWQVSPPGSSPADPVLDSVSTGFTDIPEDWSNPQAEKKNNTSSATAIDAVDIQNIMDESGISLDENGSQDVSIEIDKSTKTKARKAPLNPVNPLLRTADTRTLRSKLQETRDEDVRAAFRAKMLRPTSFAASLLIVALLVVFREPISRQFPDLASLYQLVGLDVNLTGFAIRDVKSERVIESGGPVLIVTGEIENITKEIAEAPKLRFGLQTNTHEEIYAWEHEITIPTIVPGGVARFQSRLAAPPNLGRNMTVRFVDKNA